MTAFGCSAAIHWPGAKGALPPSLVVALRRLNGECVLVWVQVLSKAGIDVPAEVGFGEYDPDSR